MNIHKIIDWGNITLLTGFTIYNMLYVKDITQLKIWMGALLLNCIIAIYAKMKFSQLASDALALAEINGELLKRSGKLLQKAGVVMMGLKLRDMERDR